MMHKYVWMLPFICFGTGYWITRLSLAPPSFRMPLLVGSSLHDGAKKLAEYHLSLKVMQSKQDTTLPHGTILDHTPVAGQWVKPRQTVCLTLSERPIACTVPDILGKPLSQVKAELKAREIPFTCYGLPSAYPKDTCIGQYPAPHESLTEPPLIFYSAEPHTKQYLVPSLCGMHSSDAISLLQEYGIDPEIVMAPPSKEAMTPQVIDQRPVPGSLIFLEHPKRIFFQLRVQKGQ